MVSRVRTELVLQHEAQVEQLTAQHQQQVQQLRSVLFTGSWKLPGF